jgi:hypothetical protein
MNNWLDPRCGLVLTDDRLSYLTDFGYVLLPAMPRCTPARLHRIMQAFAHKAWEAGEEFPLIWPEVLIG